MAIEKFQVNALDLFFRTPQRVYIDRWVNIFFVPMYIHFFFMYSTCVFVVVYMSTSSMNLNERTRRKKNSERESKYYSIYSIESTRNIYACVVVVVFNRMIDACKCINIEIMRSTLLSLARRRKDKKIVYQMVHRQHDCRVVGSSEISL